MHTRRQAAGNITTKSCYSNVSISHQICIYYTFSSLYGSLAILNWEGVLYLATIKRKLVKNGEEKKKEKGECDVIYGLWLDSEALISFQYYLG